MSTRHHHITLVLSVALTVTVGYFCRADNFTGRWQTQTNHWSTPAYTNKLEAFETIEFFRDHSFKMAAIVIIDGKAGTNVSFLGTYTTATTNSATLDAVFQNLPPGTNSLRIALPCTIDGDELAVLRAIPSVLPEYTKYRRAK
jgi:hypothetical protein